MNITRISFVQKFELIQDMFDHNHNLLHFIKYFNISGSIWDPGICQI